MKAICEIGHFFFFFIIIIFFYRFGVANQLIIRVTFKMDKTIVFIQLKILIGTHFFNITHSYLHVCAHLINFTSTH